MTKHKHLNSTYTQVIHQLGPEFDLGASEKLFMCALQGMAVDKPGQTVRINHDYMSLICCVEADGLRMVIRRLIKKGVLLRVSRGVYKATGHFRRSWGKHTHNIDLNNGYNANMTVLANAQ